MNKKDAILYIDDEAENLNGFKYTFFGKYQIFTAISPKEAWPVIENNNIKVVLSDQRMPEISGVEFLEQLAEKYPNIIRVLVTGYTDLEALIESINRAKIFRYISKPWNNKELALTINNGIAAYNMLLENRQLIHNLEVAKERAEKADAMKTAFLTNLSHEIRTPLNAIVGFTQLIMERNKELKEVQKYQKVIADSAENLTHIIDDIIQMADLESRNLSLRSEQVFPNEVISELVIIAKENKIYKDNPNLEIDFEKTLPDDFSITTDATKFTEILSNLISNALKFTPSGFVKISCESLPNQNLLKIHITDTGIGIHPKHHRDIFERFFKINLKGKLYRGNGLGLSLALEFAQLLGGQITLRSQPDYGSTFTLQIPVNQE